MAILEQVNLESKRTEPLVWVSKIMLFESLDPLMLIRDPITFDTGLNIVWGIENESNDEQFEPGHGVGKTTLCRLIRYCLGEPNYGQAHAGKEIVHTFPEGCVAAEVHIDGQVWAVLRPFNKSRADWAQVDVTIEQLIEDHPTKASFHEYQNQLSKVCLSGLRTEGVLLGDASIEWCHLLAMCARDQEARYQSLWQWRSPRSDSIPRNIQKDDAFLILRSVLNLLPDKETTLQKKLARIESEISRVEKETVERIREPDYWARHYRHSLHRDFNIEEALNASLDSDDMFNLPKLVESRINSLESQQNERRERLEELDRKIRLAAVTLQEPAELQEQQKTATDVTDAGTDTLMESLEELRQLRQLIKDMELGLCKYGQVSIGNCSHAQQQLVELDQQIRDGSLAASPVAAERDQTAAKMREHVQRRSHLIEKLTKQLNDLGTERRTLDDERRTVQNQIKSIREALNKLVKWEKLRSGNEPNNELAGLQQRKNELDSNLTSSKQQLNKLLTTQDESLKSLRLVYETLVCNTLSSDFTGRVQLTSDGLEFRVFRGENLYGEAFETLSILLADMAVLLMGATGTAAHPGILIHDSPREADLGGHIYRRLLLCVAGVAEELMDDETVPFQHIITTTTPPPTGLRKRSTTRLKLGGKNGQLFGQQLHTSQDYQQSLEFEEGSGE